MNKKNFDHKPKILIVDDESTNLRLLQQILQDDYNLSFAKNGMDCLDLAQTIQPDLILLDVMMPGMSGFDVCIDLKKQTQTQHIPVIFITARDEDHDEAYGLEIGAVDYVTKPISPAVVEARVRTHLSLVRADELKNAHLLLIQRLSRAAEYKDNETGLHIVRMSHYSKELALEYGCSESYAEDLLHAAPMHDIGKIGIPDSILLKPGKLTPEEFKVMKQHPQFGAEILGDSPISVIRTAREVALGHHEKWNGTGYPKGLAGSDIPLSARIVALADVFDALTTKRPYKEAWSVEEAMDYINEQKGQHFDPQLVDIFVNVLDRLLVIKNQWCESIP